MRAARERAFDVVLMDLHMPVLDGVGATRAIRALPDRARSTVPIVALTADAFEQTRERCLVAGMNDFLTKPVSPEKLAASLRRTYMLEMDVTQAIGRRYRRQDEIGTPYCITFDFDSLEDHAVTVRDRDTTEQVRVPIDELLPAIADRLGF